MQNSETNICYTTKRLLFKKFSYLAQKAFLTFVVILLFWTCPIANFAKQNPVKSLFDLRIKKPLQMLWEGYKENKLFLILPYTTGRFKDSILDYASGKNPSIGEWARYAQNFEILGIVQQKNHAIAGVEWSLKYPISQQRPNVYFKAVRVKYYLLYESSGWKISYAKHLGESYLVPR